MFTLFDLFKSEPFSEQEHKITLLLLYAFRRHCQREGAFLHLLPFHEFNFKWCYGMTQDNGVMGAFNPLFRKTLFLQANKNPIADILASKNPTIKYVWLLQMLPTAVHELTHAFQFQQAPVQYVVCSFPILRQFTLERDVKIPEQAACKFYEKLGNDINTISMKIINKFMRNIPYEFTYQKTADKICYYMFNPELISFEDIFEIIKKDKEL